MKIAIPLLALVVCGLVVLLERYGVTSKYQDVQQEFVSEFTDAVTDEAECLILTCKDDAVSAIYEEMITFVLEDLCVPYDVMEIEEGSKLENLSDYKTLVLTFDNWDVLGEELLTISNWVRKGGGMMNMSTPIPSAGFQALAGKLGVVSGGDSYTGITGIRVTEGYMIGADGETSYSYVAEGEAPLDISLNAILASTCEVMVTSEDGSVPIIWKSNYGRGSFVIINETVTEKYQRGFVTLAYTSLMDAYIYPVINASAYYLDDFPSPVPSGDGTYVKRDYGVSIDSFYSTVWWPKVLNWIEKYGIVYTGVVIEMYSDDVEAPFDRNYESADFIRYGNMLLKNGGEIGFHGYNHMPLCIEGVDDDQQFADYELWKTKEDAAAALTELKEFCSSLFPKESFKVYVPPSNILSDTGKKVLLETCPDIKVIASTYYEDADENAYEQEFEVEESGVIATPRVVSGLELEDYQKLTALSELNFHYVQSHFMHPDDLLDVDRGAEKGWEYLSGKFEEYLDWVYTSAPNIRDVNGSGIGNAVLQYDNLSLQRDFVRDRYEVHIGGFSGEAYFLLRINEGRFVLAEGCEVTPVTDYLYEVHATQEDIVIYIGD